MAYDESVAQRVCGALEGSPGLTEKKMFGGLCFLLNGNMCCGVLGNEIMVRVGQEAYEDALAQPHARKMDFTGKPLRGMVFVGTKGIASDEDLASWMERGVAFAGSLPAK